MFSSPISRSPHDMNVFVDKKPARPRGIFLTILGVILLDMCCDGCQSPCRAYLLDVTIQQDHPRGLSTFTIMAGLGGSFGYFLGSIDWKATDLVSNFKDDVRMLFVFVLVIYVAALIVTVTAVREIPLGLLGSAYKREDFKMEDGGGGFADETNGVVEKKRCLSGEIGGNFYGSTEKQKNEDNVIDNYHDTTPNSSTATTPPAALASEITLKVYLKSIIKMPRYMLVLCVTNLFCWMSLVCYSLYFTDFVGQTVYGGNPMAGAGTQDRIKYEDGVRMGSLAMAFYSISCSIYSMVIEKLVAKKVYVISQLVYTIGMILLSIFRNLPAVIILSPTAGIMYATLFTMPYLLIANYHSQRQNEIRGLGTDIAIVSSMVFLAQMILSLVMGSLVAALGTLSVVVCAAILSFCGALCASQVTYCDL